MKNLFIGIDFSKLTIDVSFFEREHFGEFSHRQFSNDKEGFKEMLVWMKKETRIPSSEWMFCGEHTGLASIALSEYLTAKGLFIWIDSALQIKLSMGIRRSKNDKVDSEQLALYAYRFQDKAKAYVIPSNELSSLGLLHAYRNRLIKAKVGLLQAATEMRTVIKRDPTARFIYEKTIQQINKLKKDIKEVEKKMLECIKKDPILDKSYKLLTSIIGISLVNASIMLIYTANFTRFLSARSYACYVGVAPFAKDSGTSKHAPPRISKIANKEIKALLTQAARCATRFDPQIKEYYDRKRAEGKKERVIINNIRNKIIYRAFAVINRQKPYSENYLITN